MAEMTRKDIEETRHVARLRTHDGDTLFMSSRTLESLCDLALDGLRYRWLRDNRARSRKSYTNYHSGIVATYWGFDAIEQPGETLEAAISATMKNNKRRVKI